LKPYFLLVLSSIALQERTNLEGEGSERICQIPCTPSDARRACGTFSMVIEFNIQSAIFLFLRERDRGREFRPVLLFPPFARPPLSLCLSLSHSPLMFRGRFFSADAAREVSGAFCSSAQRRGGSLKQINYTGRIKHERDVAALLYQLSYRSRVSPASSGN